MIPGLDGLPKGRPPEKNDFTWEFFPRGQTPRPPSMGTPMSKIPFFFLKKIFFRKIKHVLAPQDDFGMQKKNMLNRQKKWDWVRPPPLVWEKFPHKVVFFWRTPPIELSVGSKK